MLQMRIIRSNDFDKSYQAREVVMFPAAILAFREGLEAALILGIVLSVLGRVGRSDRARVVWLGAGLAVLISVVFGLGLHALGRSTAILRETRAPAILTAVPNLDSRVGRLIARGIHVWLTDRCEDDAQSPDSER